MKRAKEVGVSIMGDGSPAMVAACEAGPTLTRNAVCPNAHSCTADWPIVTVTPWLSTETAEAAAQARAAATARRRSMARSCAQTKKLVGEFSTKKSHWLDQLLLLPAAVTQAHAFARTSFHEPDAEKGAGYRFVFILEGQQIGGLFGTGGQR